MILFYQKTVDIPNGPVLLIRKRISILVFKYFLATKIKYSQTRGVCIYKFYEMRIRLII